MSIITDINGIPLPVAAFISKGNINDCKLFKPTYKILNKKVKNASKYLLADKGYVSKFIRKELIDDNCHLMVPSKKNSKEKHEKKILDELEALYGSDARMIVGDWFIKTMVFIKHLS